MCKKLKMVRFASKHERSGIAFASSSLTLVCSVAPPIIPPVPPVAAGRCSVVTSSTEVPPCDPSLRTDSLNPLSTMEVQQIKKACGIIDSGAPTSPPPDPFSGGGTSIDEGPMV